MPMLVKEGMVEVEVPEIQKGGPGRKSTAYYSRSMVISRDLTVFIIKNYLGKGKRALDLLAGSGIRGFRIEKECNIEVTVNENNREALKYIEKNRELNFSNAKITNCNARRCFPRGIYDYIDIDPYGTPAPFIDGAIRAVRNGGILGITATDTANLTGTNPEKTFYLYHSIPYRSYIKHEVGIRILLSFIAIKAAENASGIEPLISYFGGYYYRVFVRIKKNKKEAMRSLSYVQEIHSLGHFRKIGPLWIGNLHDARKDFIIPEHLETRERILEILNVARDENILFFYSTENIGKIMNGMIPRVEKVIELLRENGYRASRTQFSPVGFKTTCTLPRLMEILKMKDL